MKRRMYGSGGVWSLAASDISCIVFSIAVLASGGSLLYASCAVCMNCWSISSVLVVSCWFSSCIPVPRIMNEHSCVFILYLSKIGLVFVPSFISGMCLASFSFCISLVSAILMLWMWSQSWLYSVWSMMMLVMWFPSGVVKVCFVII